MTGGPVRERPVALTCPTCGGTVAPTTEGGLPGITCHLGHRLAAAPVDEAQVREAARVLGVALRMFEERAELARRLAAAQRKRGRPVSAEHWETTVREMEQGAAVLRRLLERNTPQPAPESDEGEAPGTV